MNASFIVLFKLFIRLSHKPLHFCIKLFHLSVSLSFYSVDHLIDLFHLTSIPLNFIRGIVASRLKELTLIQHLVVLGDKSVRLGDSHIIEFVLVLSAFFLEGLA
jgi:hypothetical protein